MSDAAFRAWALPDGIEPAGIREIGRERAVEIGREGGPALASPELAPAVMADLFARLRAAGRRLARRPVARRIEALGRAGERFLVADDPIRREALRLLPGTAALSPEGAREVLDAMAADWTRERFEALVASEFPGGELEPRFGPARADPAGRDARRIVVPPELALTICSGTVPGVSTTAAIRSLLVGAGTLVKPGAGDAVLPVLFARALCEVDDEVADALAVVYWPGGDADLEDRALAGADRIVVYGGGPTIRSIRARASTSATLVEYRHRVGLAVVGVGSAADDREGHASSLDRLAEDVVDAVVPYERRGCVSPVRVHAVGSDSAARELGRRVAAALERRAARTPPARTPEEAAARHQLTGSLELRRAAGESIEVWSGDGWLVAVEPSDDSSPRVRAPDGQGAGVQAAGVRATGAQAAGRVVLIDPVATVEGLAPTFDGWRGRIQSVGIAGLSPEDEARVAHLAADAGASRVGPLRDMAWPPPWWIHEGRGPLTALVDRMEWEREGP